MNRIITYSIFSLALLSTAQTSLGQDHPPQNHPLHDAPSHSTSSEQTRDLSDVPSTLTINRSGNMLNINQEFVLVGVIDSVRIWSAGFIPLSITITRDSLSWHPDLFIRGTEIFFDARFDAGLNTSSLDSIRIGNDNSDLRFDSVSISWQGIEPFQRISGNDIFAFAHAYPELNSPLFPRIVGNSQSDRLDFVSDTSVSVVSSGELLSRSRDSASTRSSFRAGSGSSQYWAEGPFAVIEDRVLLDSREFVDVRYFSDYADQKSILRTYGSAPEAIRFFNTSFGIKPKAKSIRLVELSNFGENRYLNLTGLFSAVHNASTSSEKDAWGDTWDAATEANHVVKTAAAIAFAELVETSQTSLSDTWLFTGLPLYLAALFLESDQGETAFDGLMLSLEDAYWGETQTYTRPLYFSQWNDAIDLLDEHAFARGAWTFHVIHNMIGAEAFATILQELADGKSSLTSDNLTQVLEEHLDDDQQKFQREMFYGSEALKLEAGWAYNAADRRLNLSIKHVSGASQGSQASMGSKWPPFPIDVEIETLTGIETHVVKVSPTGTSVGLPVNGRPRYIAVDPQHKLLASISIEQPVAAWVAMLRNASGIVTRIKAARTLQQFPDDPALLIGLNSALRTEQNLLVRSAILEAVGAAAPSSAARQTLLDQLGDPSEIIRYTAIRALHRYVNDERAHRSVNGLLAAERSESVLAEAVRFIGASKSPSKDGLIQSALITNTPNQLVRVAGLEALRFDLLSVSADIDAAIDADIQGGPDMQSIGSIASKYLHPEYADNVRVAALKLLQSTQTSEDHLDTITSFLGDDIPALRIAAANLADFTIPAEASAVHDQLVVELDSEVRSQIRWALYRNRQ